MAMTLAELLALFPDNTTGDIDASDMRTAITEMFNGVVGPAGPTGPTGPQGLPGIYRVALTVVSAAMTIDSSHSFLSCGTPGGTSYTLTLGTGLAVGQIIYVYNGGSVNVNVLHPNSSPPQGSAGVVTPGKTNQFIVVTAGATPLAVTVT